MNKNMDEEKRTSPVLRLIISLSLFLGFTSTLLLLRVILDSDALGALPLLLYILIIFGACASLLILILVVWRLIVTIFELDTTIEYVPDDAIGVIRQSLIDPHLKNLTDDQIRHYIAQAVDRSNMSASHTGLILNNSKLQKSLSELGMVLTDKQLDELMSAENVYLRSIGLIS